MCSDCWDNAPKAKYQFPSVEDWEDPRAAHPKRRAKRKRREPVPKGCPETGGKAHVYVIIEVHGYRPRYVYEIKKVDYVAETWWEKVCIGCGKHKMTYRDYFWGGSPVGRYFNKEDIYEVVTKEKGFHSYRW